MVQTDTAATGEIDPAPSTQDYLAPVLWFFAGTGLILCCAFTLPRLPAAVEVLGPWTVWGGFTIVTLVAGILFWSNLQKLYALLTR
ncbi:hypothetical protein [Tsukamurella tyrosinosolvens]|uniref:hypothetical protein n=1 Tax=Tsukamurella tyrosinosolvens TaxID=57704 RepID=UPI002DD44B5A|nr:hypothetical protein [Tsukamurella tyrosinosolvens]MEC4616431.1 hypothetical protein [Tsukamurella tyrosinosolvens]